MNRISRVEELKRLQAQVEELRAELAFSPPGVIWLGDSDAGMIIVEADGLGAATASIVEGNYPVDYCARFAKRFRREKDAESVALKIVTGKVCPTKVLDRHA
jgi:hypothetical protein